MIQTEARKAVVSVIFPASVAVFFTIVGCGNNGVARQDVIQSFCDAATAVAAEAEAMRGTALRDLDEAATHVEIANRVDAGEELTEEQQSLRAVGAGTWRHAWQYADAAGASCEASVRTHRLIGRILMMARSHMREESPGAERVRAAALKLSTSDPSGERSFDCSRATFHRQFSSTYRQDVVTVARDWAASQKQSEDEAIATCNNAGR